MRRDVTELLAVSDEHDGLTDALLGARAIRGGHGVVVADDATAVATLTRLGMTLSEAVDQVRGSYGPLTRRDDPRVRHLATMEQVTTASPIRVPHAWATTTDREKDQFVDAALTDLWSKLNNQSSSDDR